MATAFTLIFVVFFNGEDCIQTDRVVGHEPIGVSFGPQIEVYYLILFWTLLTVVLMYLITKTPFGRMSNAVRDNAERAAFIGYNVRHVRCIAFTLSAMFAGAPYIHPFHAPKTLVFLMRAVHFAQSCKLQLVWCTAHDVPL